MRRTTDPHPADVSSPMPDTITEALDLEWIWVPAAPADTASLIEMVRGQRPRPAGPPHSALVYDHSGRIVAHPRRGTLSDTTG